jgi:hypothetical protein
MTAAASDGQDAALQLSNDYRDSVGSVMAARKQYDLACADQGNESQSARRAQDDLAHAIDHRNQLREQYDLVLNRGAPR